MRAFSWLPERMGVHRRVGQGKTAKPAPRLRPRLEALEGRAVLSTLAVTSTLDDVSQRGTLRYAVANAGDGDVILLTGAVARAGITLTQGELLLTQHDLTITSAAPAIPVTVSGGNVSRVFEIAPGASVTLSDLTVSGGNGLTGNPLDHHEGRGGGIVVDEGASLTITGCTVTGNSVNFVALPGGGFAGGLGGGIADYGTLAMSGCTVSDNHALGTFGGGIAVFSGAPFSARFSATLTVTDSSLSANTAQQNGGAICDVFSTVTLDHCSVTGNSVSDYSGGGLNNHGGTMTVSHSLVADNAAPNGFGGGIYNYLSSTLTVDDCDVRGNSAVFGGGIGNAGTLVVKDQSVLSYNSASYCGGAIENGGTATISDSTLDHNFTTGDYGLGGGICNFGMLTISDSQITNNSADWGGGIDNEYGTVALSGCLLSGNSATSGGGAIDNEDTVTIDDCTLSGNSASFGGGIFNDYASLTVNGSTFSANTPDNILGGYTGSGNTGLP